MNIERNTDSLASEGGTSQCLSSQFSDFRQIRIRNDPPNVPLSLNTLISRKSYLKTCHTRESEVFPIRNPKTSQFSESDLNMNKVNIFNHKHLQYIPKSSIPRTQQHGASTRMTSFVPNGNNQQLHHSFTGRQPTSNSGETFHEPNSYKMNEKSFKYFHHTNPPPPYSNSIKAPTTKSIGVGANLNYTRGTQILTSSSLEHREISNVPLSHSSDVGRENYLQSSHHQHFGNGSMNHLQPHAQTSATSQHSVSGGPFELGHGDSTSTGHNSASILRTLPSTPRKLTEDPVQNASPTRDGTHLPLISPKLAAQRASGNVGSSHKNIGQKIVSQNLNGTLSVTGVPSNDSELQLFRVLQRANLLNYFDVMIELGGDDVQQLWEAAETEFLEIMDLIGMASKPLHVRRLQKALQEFMTQPHLFPNPTLGPTLTAYNQMVSSNKSQPIRPIPFHSTGIGTLKSPSFNPDSTITETSKAFSLNYNTDKTQSVYNSTSIRTDVPPNLHPSSTQTNSGGSIIPFVLPNGLSVQIPSPSAAMTNPSSNDGHSTSETDGKRISADSKAQVKSTNTDHPDSRTCLSPVPCLQEHEIEKIRESAIKLIQTLTPELTLPKISAKRRSTDFETVIRIPDEDPKKEEEVRKYATIYARFNCKRKAQKPLTIHELSANEAASQLCLRIPALLTRREELKQLSREVIKNAGLPYSSIICAPSYRDHVPSQKVKRTASSSDTDEEYTRPKSAPLNQNLPEDMTNERIKHIDGPISRTPDTLGRPRSSPEVQSYISNSRKRLISDDTEPIALTCRKFKGSKHEHEQALQSEILSENDVNGSQKYSMHVNYENAQGDRNV